MYDKTAYHNYQDFKTCLNCDHSYIMCGELICRWNETYVSPTGKCSWWVKKFDKENAIFNGEVN